MTTIDHNHVRVTGHITTTHDPRRSILESGTELRITIQHPNHPAPHQGALIPVIGQLRYTNNETIIAVHQLASHQPTSATLKPHVRKRHTRRIRVGPRSNTPPKRSSSLRHSLTLRSAKTAPCHSPARDSTTWPAAPIPPDSSLPNSLRGPQTLEAARRIENLKRQTMQDPD